MTKVGSKWIPISEQLPWPRMCTQRVMSLDGHFWHPLKLSRAFMCMVISVWQESRCLIIKLGLNADDKGIALYAQCLCKRVLSPEGLLKLVFEKPISCILGVSHHWGDDYGFDLKSAIS